MTDAKITELALAAGAARFYPARQSDWNERNYLVGQRFLQRFAEAVALEARAVGAVATPRVAPTELGSCKACGYQLRLDGSCANLCAAAGVLGDAK